MASDLPDFTKSVDVSAGTVTITGPVTVDGTITADLAAGATGVVEPGTSPIDISGAVDASLAAGSTVIVEPGTSPIDISGAVDITAGSVTIVEGQGGSTPVQISTPPKSVGQVKILAGQLTGSLIFTPDVEATGLAALISTLSQPGRGTVSAFITGSNSGFTYAQASSAAGDLADILQAVVIGSVEPIEILITTTVASGSDLVAANAYETFGSRAVSPVNSPFQPLYVAGTGLNPLPVVVGGDQGPAANAVQVVHAAPGGNAVIYAALAPGGTLALVGGVAGKSIRLRRFHMSISAAGFVYLEQTGPLVELWADATTAELPGADLDWEGYSLAAGTAVQLRNASALVTDLVMPPRIVVEIDIKVPPGPRGEMGFALWASGLTVIPEQASTWIVADDEEISWPLQDQIDSGGWQLAAYNLGQYDHTVYLRFLVSPTTSPAVGVGPQPIPAAQLSSSAA